MNMLEFFDPKHTNYNIKFNEPYANTSKSGGEEKIKKVGKLYK